METLMMLLATMMITTEAFADSSSNWLIYREIGTINEVKKCRDSDLLAIRFVDNNKDENYDIIQTQLLVEGRDLAGKVVYSAHYATPEPKEALIQNPDVRENGDFSMQSYLQYISEGGAGDPDGSSFFRDQVFEVTDFSFKGNYDFLDYKIRRSFLDPDSFLAHNFELWLKEGPVQQTFKCRYRRIQ